MEVTLVHPDAPDEKVVATSDIQVAAFKQSGFVEPAELDAIDQQTSESNDLQAQLDAANSAATDAAKAQADAEKKATADVKAAQKAQADAEKRADAAEKALADAKATNPGGTQ